jgi:hypothetical protein
VCFEEWDKDVAGPVDGIPYFQTNPYLFSQTSTLWIFFGNLYMYIPVVPHKAVVEVSKIGNRRRRGWFLCITDG